MRSYSFFKYFIYFLYYTIVFISQFVAVNCQDENTNQYEKVTQLFHNNISLPQYMKDKHHGIVMGEPNQLCDDGEIHLDVDLNVTDTEHTCFTPKNRLTVHYDLAYKQTCVDVPKEYSPRHYCMDKKIEYLMPIPLLGGHRPLWATYGRYSYLPPQRWMHNVEHGAVVLLYHPCVDSNELAHLKLLVRGCLWKYIMTPYGGVTEERPFVLVAWGCKLEMSYVDPSAVVSFIQQKAFKGPEGLHTVNGLYNLLLLEGAKYISDVHDPNKLMC